MAAIEIKPDIYWIGVNDRTSDLFEGLWPITQEGISYNAYFINDERKAIIDLTKSFKADEFFTQIEEIADISQLDYIIINHMEPDHTGVVNLFRKLAPRATILGTEKTVQMLKAFFGITEKVQAVKDGQTLLLGKRQLQFFYTPFVHWPETMMTYETTQGILFSCDGFGGYGALRGGIFDDQCKDPDFYQREALRYYSNIVARFSRNVLNAIDKLKAISISIVAPSHGLIWRDKPGRIIELYEQWARYATGKTEAGVTLIYGSMYGNTEAMMNAVAQGISRTGIPLEIFDAARTHASYILPSLWRRQGVVIGAPTYEVTLFPPVGHVLDIAVHKGVRNKKAALFGSYGWSGGAQGEIKRIIEPAKWEVVDAFEFIGAPTKEDLKRGEESGAAFAERLKDG
ncbi:MAG: FprA family A-type flavoprotein [Desulfobacterales bacterium]|nr:FprA family A-type flavoprotein [Desulfobacterales bacterium]